MDEQFARIPIGALKAKLTARAWKTLVAIAAHADDRGEAYPGLTRLASLTGIDKGDLSRVVDELVDAGLIARVRGGARSRGRPSNLYRVAGLCRSTVGVETDGQQTDSKVTDGSQAARTVGAGADLTDQGNRPKSKERRTPGAHRIPEDWQPNDLDRQYAMNRGLSAAEIDTETEKFKDHHIAKGSRFERVDRAWRTWLHNRETFISRNAAAPASYSHRGTISETEVAYNLAERLEAEECGR